MCCFVLSSNAQFRVNSNGNVSVGTTETPLSMLSINNKGNNDWKVSLLSSGYGVYSKREGSNSGWGCALFGGSANANTNFSVGVRGEAFSYTVLNSGRSFGIMGIAGNATSGWNYGVYGRLDGTNNGAAIYGTTNSTENGSNTGGKYAGYFNGATKVVGNLSVTGSISGTVLNKAVSTLEKRNAETDILTVDETATGTSMTEKIKGMTAIPYYITPDNNLTKTINNADTVEVERAMSMLEAQNLSKKHYALSVERIQESFPDLVYENEDGTTSVNYMEMIPILVQTINELNNRLQSLEQRYSLNKTRSAGNGDNIYNDIVLGNNSPNPFSTETSIEYNIPNGVNEAALCIYDMSGKQKNKFIINERGKGSIDITANNFNEGLYVYALIIDGNVYDTKKMIITK